MRRPRVISRGAPEPCVSRSIDFDDVPKGRFPKGMHDRGRMQLSTFSARLIARRPCNRPMIYSPCCPATCGSSKQRRTSTRMTGATQFSHFVASRPVLLATLAPSTARKRQLLSLCQDPVPRAAPRSQETEHAHPRSTAHCNTVTRHNQRERTGSRSHTAQPRGERRLR